MTTRLVKISEWLKDEWLSVVMWIALYWVIMLSLVIFSWLFGYWWNGITSGKFDLASCWQGITAVLAGIGTLISAGVLAWMRFNTNSRFNTLLGSNMPIQATNEPKGEPSNERI